jgi:chromosome segregation ATPase
MSAETKLEGLTAEFVAADNEFARLSAKASQAILEFDSRKLSAPAAEFGKLKDNMDQAILRRDSAKSVRARSRATLDAALEIQARQDAREALRKEMVAGEQKLAEMDATIRAARADLTGLMNALPEMEKQRNWLLRQLAALRQAAANTVAA